MAKERLDVLLVERGLAASRERARTMIMEGRVLVDGKKVEKAGTGVKSEAELRLLGEEMPYVSRGGLKLEKALRAFSISLAGKTMADIGASTGGFTDCALQNGATKVYAIDVGYGQLAWKLRTDARVKNMERTNIRHVTPEALGELVDFASIDVAFISLAKVLPAVRSLLKPQGEVAALIKPQFEAGRENVGKKGVVRDPHVHEIVIRDVFRAAQEAGFCIRALSYSPVKGPEGNIEYLMHLVGTGEESAAPGVSQEEIVAVVAKAHTELDK
ncbi:MAG: TlyA family RNA methyltransferase [Selenomonas sp.]